MAELAEAVKPKTEEELREEFHAERRRGIFATDVGPILGISRYGYGPLDVALQKLGIQTVRHNDRIGRGTRYEPLIAEEYSEVTGIPIVKAKTEWSPNHPWAGAHGDYRAADRDLLVEVKMTADGRGWGEPGTDQVPKDILIQTQWQMECYAVPECHVAALIRGEFHVYEIPRSQPLIDELLRLCGEFWAMLQRGEMPPLEWDNPRTATLVPLMYKPDDKLTVELNDVAQALVDEMDSLKETKSTLESLIDLKKAQVAEMMKTASVGLLPDGEREVRRKIISKAAYTVKAREEVRLTVNKRRA